MQWQQRVPVNLSLENVADLLYPPHMRRLPVKADLPCSTRQLSKTTSKVGVSQSIVGQSIGNQMNETIKHVRSILPGFSWNQY
jgi:hypothetical protein